MIGSEDEDDITTDTKLRSYAQALEEEGIDADEIVMDAVIQESLETARAEASGTAGAGGSKAKPSRNAAAALRAAAAERRLTRAKGEPDVIDVDAIMSDALDSDIEILSDSSEEPLAKPRGKGKGKGKAKAAPKATRSKAKGKGKGKKGKGENWERDLVTLTELKREEKALRKRLGRKLTQVSGSVHVLIVNANVLCSTRRTPSL